MRNNLGVEMTSFGKSWETYNSCLTKSGFQLQNDHAIYEKDQQGISAHSEISSTPEIHLILMDIHV